MTQAPRSLDVVGLRLRNQRLAGSTVRRPEELVAHLGAVQAQEYGPARWALGQRLVSGSDADVARAVDDGRIIRTHILRPTWHFVAPADLRWMLALSSPRVHRANGFSYRTSQLDGKRLARGADLIARALEGHRHLMRAELGAALKRARLPHAGHGLACVVMYAELEGIICSGPRRGKQFTYALVDERVPASAPRAADESLAELTRRYFTSHGPATIRDFVWWSGLTVAQTRRGLSMLGRALTSAEIDGRLHYWSPDARAPRAGTVQPVYLLPIYDEFLIAYKDRQWCTGTYSAWPVDLARQHPHQLLIDGRVEGAWRRTLSEAEVAIDVVPFRRLTRSERLALEAAADRMGRFLDLEPRLQVQSHA